MTRIKKQIIILFAGFFILITPLFALYAYLESGLVKEGGLVKIKIGNRHKIKAADVEFMGKKYPAFLKGYDKKEYEYVYFSFLPVPLESTGRKKIMIHYMLADGSGHYQKEFVTIKKLKVEVTNLDTGGQMSAELLKALRKENRFIKKAQEKTMSIMFDLPFIRPVEGKGTRESTPFGRTRIYDGGAAKWRHKGIDIAAPAGTDIKAANHGVVSLASYGKGHGNMVIINHGGGISSLYYHMKKVHVKHGQKVKKGDVIGAVGSTGLSTGPHLHWQINVFGVPVNPVELLTDFR